MAPRGVFLSVFLNLKGLENTPQHSHQMNKILGESVAASSNDRHFHPTPVYGQLTTLPPTLVKLYTDKTKVSNYLCLLGGLFEDSLIFENLFTNINYIFVS